MRRIKNYPTPTLPTVEECVKAFNKGKEIYRPEQNKKEHKDNRERKYCKALFCTRFDEFRCCRACFKDGSCKDSCMNEPSKCNLQTSNRVYRLANNDVVESKG